jgi:hypothetical protein
MTWNYRVLRYTDGTLALHEVFYDDEGRPNGYTARPISFAVDADEGHDGLIQSMKMALGDAIERPILDVPDLPGTPVQQEPLNGNTSYDDVAAELLASEGAISEVFVGHFEPNKLLTHADFFGMGIGRRALALSSGFRLMIEHRNSLCALPMVRMQLDTALRLYAGFFVTNHQKFCLDVLQGKQIDRLKSDDGLPMKDRYLVDRVATLNPWIVDVSKSRAQSVPLNRL